MESGVSLCGVQLTEIQIHFTTSGGTAASTHTIAGALRVSTDQAGHIEGGQEKELRDKKESRKSRRTRGRGRHSSETQPETRISTPNY
jgi:hypothetical protein